jgi:hypothetical protein
VAIDEAQNSQDRSGLDDRQLDRLSRDVAFIAQKPLTTASTTVQRARPPRRRRRARTLAAKKRGRLRPTGHEFEQPLSWGFRVAVKEEVTMP